MHGLTDDGIVGPDTIKWINMSFDDRLTSLALNAERVRSMETVDTTEIDWQTINFNSFPYRMRQKAGSRNALGLYKFNTPNKRAIYLHDTPSKGLFNDDFRAYSNSWLRSLKS
ncbi:L,D-transpeptidase family protein [Vibrio splendidus]|uniref:L,D-transpeptidase family protein n=1 Tax=Vibrio splendidus TaxID=29497 RepID=UPI0039A75C91